MIGSPHLTRRGFFRHLFTRNFTVQCGTNSSPVSPWALSNSATVAGDHCDQTRVRAELCGLDSRDSAARTCRPIFPSGGVRVLHAIPVNVVSVLADASPAGTF